MNRGKILTGLSIVWLCLSHRVVCAQMAVENEPHHKVVFENQVIRLIELKVLPGDTTLVHSHTVASAVIFLSTSNLAIQNQGEQPVVTAVKPGDAVYRQYNEKPAVHTVWSADQSTFRCMVVELKPGEYNSNCEIPSSQSIEMLWQQKMINAYRLDFRRVKKVKLPKSKSACVLIDYEGKISTNASGEKSRLGLDDFVFIPAGREVEIHSSSGRAILLQLKYN